MSHHRRVVSTAHSLDDESFDHDGADGGGVSSVGLAVPVSNPVREGLGSGFVVGRSSIVAQADDFPSDYASLTFDAPQARAPIESTRGDTGAAAAAAWRERRSANAGDAFTRALLRPRAPQSTAPPTSTVVGKPLHQRRVSFATNSAATGSKVLRLSTTTTTTKGAENAATPPSVIEEDAAGEEEPSDDASARRGLSNMSAVVHAVSSLKRWRVRSVGTVERGLEDLRNAATAFQEGVGGHSFAPAVSAALALAADAQLAMRHSRAQRTAIEADPRIRLGGEAASAYRQGDLAHYSTVRCLQRLANSFHAPLLHLVKRAFDVVALPSGHVPRNAYLHLLLLAHYQLMPNTPAVDAVQHAFTDWRHDSVAWGSPMPRPAPPSPSKSNSTNASALTSPIAPPQRRLASAVTSPNPPAAAPPAASLTPDDEAELGLALPGFHAALFQLVDQWTATCEAGEYVALLSSLLSAATQANRDHDSAKVHSRPLILRPLPYDYSRALANALVTEDNERARQQRRRARPQRRRGHEDGGSSSGGNSASASTTSSAAPSRPASKRATRRYTHGIDTSNLLLTAPIPASAGSPDGDEEVAWDEYVLSDDELESEVSSLSSSESESGFDIDPVRFAERAARQVARAARVERLKRVAEARARRAAMAAAAAAAAAADDNPDATPSTSDAADAAPAGVASPPRDASLAVQSLALPPGTGTVTPSTSTPASPSPARRRWKSVITPVIAVGKFAARPSGAAATALLMAHMQELLQHAATGVEDAPPPPPPTSSTPGKRKKRTKKSAASSTVGSPETPGSVRRLKKTGGGGGKKKGKKKSAPSSKQTTQPPTPQRSPPPSNVTFDPDHTLLPLPAVAPAPSLVRPDGTMDYSAMSASVARLVRPRVATASVDRTAEEEDYIIRTTVRELEGPPPETLHEVDTLKPSPTPAEIESQRRLLEAERMARERRDIDELEFVRPTQIQRKTDSRPESRETLQPKSPPPANSAEEPAPTSNEPTSDETEKEAPPADAEDDVTLEVDFVAVADGADDDDPVEGDATQEDDEPTDDAVESVEPPVVDDEALPSHETVTVESEATSSAPAEITMEHVVDPDPAGTPESSEVEDGEESSSKGGPTEGRSLTTKRRTKSPSNLDVDVHATQPASKTAAVRGGAIRHRRVASLRIDSTPSSSPSTRHRRTASMSVELSHKKSSSTTTPTSPLTASLTPPTISEKSSGSRRRTPDARHASAGGLTRAGSTTSSSRAATRTPTGARTPVSRTPREGTPESASASASGHASPARATTPRGGRKSMEQHGSGQKKALRKKKHQRVASSLPVSMTTPATVAREGSVSDANDAWLAQMTALGNDPALGAAVEAVARAAADSERVLVEAGITLPTKHDGDDDDDEDEDDASETDGDDEGEQSNTVDRADPNAADANTTPHEATSSETPASAHSLDGAAHPEQTRPVSRNEAAATLPKRRDEQNADEAAPSKHEDRSNARALQNSSAATPAGEETQSGAAISATAPPTSSAAAGVNSSSSSETDSSSDSGSDSESTSESEGDSTTKPSSSSAAASTRPTAASRTATPSSAADSALPDDWMDQVEAFFGDGPRSRPTTTRGPLAPRAAASASQPPHMHGGPSRASHATRPSSRAISQHNVARSLHEEVKAAAAVSRGASRPSSSVRAVPSSLPEQELAASQAESSTPPSTSGLLSDAISTTRSALRMLAVQGGGGGKGGAARSLPLELSRAILAALQDLAPVASLPIAPTLRPLSGVRVRPRPSPTVRQVRNEKETRAPLPDPNSSGSLAELTDLSRTLGRLTEPNTSRRPVQVGRATFGRGATATTGRSRPSTSSANRSLSPTSRRVTGGAHSPPPLRQVHDPERILRDGIENMRTGGDETTTAAAAAAGASQHEHLLHDLHAFATVGGRGERELSPLRALSPSGRDFVSPSRASLGHVVPPSVSGPHVSGANSFKLASSSGALSPLLPPSRAPSSLAPSAPVGHALAPAPFTTLSVFASEASIIPVPPAPTRGHTVLLSSGERIQGWTHHHQSANETDTNESDSEETPNGGAAANSASRKHRARGLAEHADDASAESSPNTRLRRFVAGAKSSARSSRAGGGVGGATTEEAVPGSRAATAPAAGPTSLSNPVVPNTRPSTQPLAPPASAPTQEHTHTVTPFDVAQGVRDAFNENAESEGRTANASAAPPISGGPDIIASGEWDHAFTFASDFAWRMPEHQRRALVARDGGGGGGIGARMPFRDLAAANFTPGAYSRAMREAADRVRTVDTTTMTTNSVDGGADSDSLEANQGESVFAASDGSLRGWSAPHHGRGQAEEEKTSSPPSGLMTAPNGEGALASRTTMMLLASAGLRHVPLALNTTSPVPGSAHYMSPYLPSAHPPPPSQAAPDSAPGVAAFPYEIQSARFAALTASFNASTGGSVIPIASVRPKTAERWAASVAAGLPHRSGSRGGGGSISARSTRASSPSTRNSTGLPLALPAPRPNSSRMSAPSRFHAPGIDRARAPVAPPVTTVPSIPRKRFVPDGAEQSKNVVPRASPRGAVPFHPAEPESTRFAYQQSPAQTSTPGSLSARHVLPAGPRGTPDTYPPVNVRLGSQSARAHRPLPPHQHADANAARACRACAAHAAKEKELTLTAVTPFYPPPQPQTARRHHSKPATRTASRDDHDF